jgi:hypothetical protein
MFSISLVHGRCRCSAFSSRAAHFAPFANPRACSFACATLTPTCLSLLMRAVWSSLCRLGTRQNVPLSACARVCAAFLPYLLRSFAEPREARQTQRGLHFASDPYLAFRAGSENTFVALAYGLISPASQPFRFLPFPCVSLVVTDNALSCCGPSRSALTGLAAGHPCQTPRLACIALTANARGRRSALP